MKGKLRSLTYNIINSYPSHQPTRQQQYWTEVEVAMADSTKPRIELANCEGLKQYTPIPAHAD